jgi:aquaporin Z
MGFLAKWTMELVGTFTICYVSCMARGSLYDQAISQFIVYTFMIYAGANISGAHYNPAVTMGLLLVRRCEVYDSMFYILFQFSGAILGGALAAYLLDGDINK